MLVKMSLILLFLALFLFLIDPVSCSLKNAFIPMSQNLKSRLQGERLSSTFRVFNNMDHFSNSYQNQNPYRSKNLNLSPRIDNLVAGIADISIGFSVGVLESEFAIISTGCGPMGLSDTLERLCYQGLIVFAGLSIFSRIAFRKDIVAFSEDYFGYLEESTLWQLRIADMMSLTGVVGAFVALGIQIYKGENMEGLSGINVEMCRAIRDL